MRRFRAGVPWQAVLHSWTLLDSHDTARFGAVAGDRERQLVGVGLQMTTPGVPMVCAGDELGVGGRWGEDARRPMPWADADGWDCRPARGLPPADRAATVVRRARAWGHPLRGVATDAIAYLRESPREPVLCLAARAPHEALRLPVGGAGLHESRDPAGRRRRDRGWGAVAARGRSGVSRLETAFMTTEEAEPWLRWSSRTSTRSTRATCTPSRTCRSTCGRGVPRPRRPVGLRQDDGAADGRRARGDHRRDDQDRRSGRQHSSRRRIATSRWSSRTTRSTRT